MASTTYLTKLAQRTKKFASLWQKKLRYLSEAISRSGKKGINHWIKFHPQIEEFEGAIGELIRASEQESFNLLQVDTTLRCFNLPEEDRDQHGWYKTAHHYLFEFEQKLIQENRFDIKALQAALNELKFISQSNEFHIRYNLQSIQEKVIKVYQNLLQMIREHKIQEKEKANAEKESHRLKMAQAEENKAKAEAKKVMLENIKIKEKRIAIIEDRKRKAADKELIEAENIRQQENAEIEAKRAEIERQNKLQEAYIDLQLEEKISHWDISDFAEKLTIKLDQTSLTEQQKHRMQQLISDIDQQLNKES